MELRNPAYTIGAGLSYTTQLLHLIAYFLDVNLPKRLCYGYVMTSPNASATGTV